MTEPALTKSMWEALVKVARQEAYDAGESDEYMADLIVKGIDTFFEVRSVPLEILSCGNNDDGWTFDVGQWSSSGDSWHTIAGGFQSREAAIDYIDAHE